MPSVRVRDNEPFDIAIRRFKRACEKAGVLAEVHRREFYEKPTSVRKRKAAAAIKRWQKKRVESCPDKDREYRELTFKCPLRVELRKRLKVL